MKIDILTLFPDSVAAVLKESIIGRAAAKGILSIKCRQIRDYSDNKQNQVDDYPYGGGWGCVMMAQPLYGCLQAVLKEAGRERVRVIYMSPQGEVFTQKTALRLARGYDRLILVCGHYEGVDERFIQECAHEEISIGDFVMTGGEIPALAVADAVCRLVPGVLSNEECYKGESHWDGCLEYPQYTRPETWMGRAVPEILRSGDHAKIAYWRRKQSLLRTRERRPELYERLPLDGEIDKRILAELNAWEKCEKKRFECRRAVQGDLPEMLSIADGARSFLKANGVDQWQEEYPGTEDFLSDISKEAAWVFTNSGVLTGIISIFVEKEAAYDRLLEGEWLSDGLYAVIHRVAVSPECRRSGLATEMISFAEDIALGSGAAGIRADTHRDNTPMRALLDSRGFSLRGKVYYGGDRERLVYEKLL